LSSFDLDELTQAGVQDFAGVGAAKKAGLSSYDLVDIVKVGLKNFTGVGTDYCMCITV